MMDVAERLQRIRDEIAEAAWPSQREVQLVAVTKTVPPERIAESYEAGQRIFGENRVQEAQGKIDLLSSTMPEARWHLIGHLQSNKARAAATLFSLIESIDTARLAERLNAAAVDRDAIVPVLLEVNVAEEESKSGFSAPGLLEALPRMKALPGLEIRGLMTIAPLSQRPDEVRWVFRELRRLRDELQEKHDLTALTELSMGMSNDFRVAIEEGATMVRIGRALFGERPVEPEKGR